MTVSTLSESSVSAELISTTYLPWAFAANKTVHDSWEKRRKKGYLFTIGDENFPLTTDKAFTKASCGKFQEYSPEALLQAAQETYHVFHIIINPAHYARKNPRAVLENWKEHLG